MRFKYRHFLCFQDELQSFLDTYGAQGWRLHTCDPVLPMGLHGSGSLQAFVVMDQIVDEEDEPVVAEPESEGIAMKG